MLIALSISLLFPFKTAFGQDSDNSRTAIETIQSLPLDSAKHGVMVYFSNEGNEGKVKAGELGPKIAGLMVFFEESLGVDLDFSLALLDEKLWKDHLQYPYVPHIDQRSSPAIAYLPLESDWSMYDFLMDLEDDTSDELRKKIADSGYTWKGFSKKASDLIIIHEIGHLYAETYGIAKPSKWFDEFVANYFAYAFIHAATPEDADIWKLLGDVMFEGHEPQHRTLNEFEELYAQVGVMDFMWFESALQIKANPLVEKRGVSFIRDLKKAFPEGTGNLSNKEIIEKLDKMAPGFNEWAEIFEEKNHNETK